MFNNSGKKIKSVSKFLCYIGIAASLTLLILCVTIHLAILGITIAALGISLSWASSILCYGFGELIENSQKTCILLEKRLKDDEISFKKLDVQNPASTSAPQSPASNSTPVSAPDSGAHPESISTAFAAFSHRTDQPIFCPECGEKQPGNRSKCWSCGIAFKYDDEK